MFVQNTYKSILDSYARRLISTNSRTRTIYYSKDDKGISDISFFVRRVDKEEFLSFLCDETKELKLSYGPLATGKVFELFENYIKDNNEEEILNEYFSFSKNDFELLKKEKHSVFTELYNKYERIKKKELHQLFKIKENNDELIKVSGKDDMYIGYPYIQGRFNKDKVVRAPLILHKITLKETGGYIIISNEGTKLLNPVFVMSYLVENELTYKDSLDFEILDDDYFETAQNMCVLVQAEGKRAIENLDEILEIPGIDVIFVGPYDLSSSLGLIGQIDHPKVIDLAKEVIRKASAKGIKVGCFADNVESAKRWRNLGVRFIGYSCDTNIFMRGAQEDVRLFAEEM